MKSTPTWLAWISSVLLGLLAAGNFLSTSSVDTEGWRPWLRWLAEFVRGQGALWIFCLTLAGIMLQLAHHHAGKYGFRKERAQRILSRVVKHLLDDDAVHNRCTLFRQVRGANVFVRLVYRTIVFQDNKWRNIRELRKINPLGLYLYAYARPERSTNEHSCSFWRVYRTQQHGAGGVAGRVWELGEYSVRDAYYSPHSKVFHPGALKTIGTLDDLQDVDPVKIYAASTNVSDPGQLRAREIYGRHFHGTVIESDDGKRKWGVLLVDSTLERCPFPECSTPEVPDPAMWKKRFRGYGETLSTILT